MFYDPMENQFPDDSLPPQQANSLYEYTVEYYPLGVERKLAVFLGHTDLYTSKVFAPDEHWARRFAVTYMLHCGYCVSKFININLSES